MREIPPPQLVAHRSRRWFYLWLVPLLWIAGAWMGFHHPGDEYGMWVISALPGTWIASVLDNVGDIHGFLPLALITGALVLTPVGFCMDRLRVPFRFWSAAILLGTLALTVETLRRFDSVSSALAKNGSLTAYLCFAYNISLVLVCLLFIAVLFVARLVWRFPRNPDPHSPG